MSKLIDVDAVIGKLENEIETKCEPVTDSDSAIEAYIKETVPKLLRDVINYLKHQPTIDAVEVVHGRWIDIYDGIYINPIFKCSICGNSAPIEERYPVIGRMYTDWSFTNYCPHCGAKMEGDV